MEFDFKIIAFGVLGGVIAELIRLSKDRNNLSIELTSFNTYASMVLLAIIGAFATVIFGASTVKEAASIGIAAPVLLSNLAAKPGPANPPPPPPPMSPPSPMDDGEYRQQGGAGLHPESGPSVSFFIDTMRRRWSR